MAESLKQKTVGGVIWSSIERFSVAGLQFVIMIIMARVLTPEDYGMVAMLQIFIAVSQSLVDSGFSQALIRKLDRTQTDLSTVFYFNIGIGVFLYLVLFFSAPLIASFYQTPQLVPITRVIALGMVFNSLAVVQRAVLTIKIDFKTQMRASVLAAVISGIVGISMAYTGFGVWAIVAQQVTNLGINTLVLWIVSKWSPSKVFSMVSFKEMFGFGSKLLLSGLINTIWNNIYLIVIGKAFSKADLGYYTRAHQFSDFPSANLTSVFQRVTYPVLSTIQNDDERLATNYRRVLRVTAYIIFPIMTGMAAVSTPMIRILLTDKWLFTADLLKIICLSMMFFPVHSINLNLLQVKGRSDLFLRLEIIKKIIGIIILIVTIPMGLIAMCIGQIFSSLFSLAINTHYTGKLINIGFIKQMKDLIPILVLSLVMGVVSYLVMMPFENVYIQLGLGIITGIVFYILFSYVFKFEEMNELVSIIRKK